MYSKKQIHKLIMGIIAMMVAINASAQNSIEEGIFLNASYIQIRGKDAQKFNGFCYSNSYVKRISSHNFLSGLLSIGYAMNTQKEYPYYLFNKRIVSSDLTILHSIKKIKKSSILVGVGMTVGYFNKSLLEDFVISSGFSISVPQPSGPSYTIPLIHPKRELKEFNYLTIGYGVGFQQHFSLSKNTMIGYKADYKQYASREIIYSVGLSFLLKL